MKKRIARALFENLSEVSKESLLESESFKKLIKDQAPNAIEEAYKGKKVFASLFEINTSGNFIEIHRNYWIQALESCLIWYIEDEDYETCNNIKNLVKELQTKQRRFKTQPDGE